MSAAVTKRAARCDGHLYEGPPCRREGIVEMTNPRAQQPIWVCQEHGLYAASEDWTAEDPDALWPFRVECMSVDGTWMRGETDGVEERYSTREDAETDARFFWGDATPWRVVDVRGAS